MLHFSSSSNIIVDSARAMADCIESAMTVEERQTCVLIVIHATIGHQFQVLLTEARKLCPTAKLVGCSVAGVIGKGIVSENLQALAIMAIRTEEEKEVAATSCPQLGGDDAFERGREMAQELYAQQPKVKMLYLLSSSIDIAADQLIAGIESVFGNDIPIVGGTASDNMRAVRSIQLYEQQQYNQGAVLVGLADPSLELVTGVHHGNVPIGIGYTVTRAEQNRIYEIEGEPAWTFLMQKLNLPKDLHPGHCLALTSIGELLPPKEQALYDNTHILRAIFKADTSDHSFYYPVKCTTGTKIWLTQRDEELIFKGLERMMNHLTEAIGEREVVAVFHADCAARGRALFNRILKEEIVHRMQYPLSGEEQCPWLGMYGFGEYSMLNGKNRYHNYTSSLYVFLRNKR